MEFVRSAGVLLHVTSLPGRYGIGDLGQPAYKFVDWLVAAGQYWWQILPLGHPGIDTHHDPYSTQSSWAGSPYLVSLDQLVEAGDLRSRDVTPWRVDDSARVDYRAVEASRAELLVLAAQRFFERREKAEMASFRSFCRKESWWLEDWALFSALKQQFGQAPWWLWDQSAALRDPTVLEEWTRRLEGEIRVHKYIQFRFFEQWDRLRDYAHRSGVGIIGDLPIYCAHDSQDVWAAREMFKLNPDGTPQAVGGVPPDFFSDIGQLWGNPVYDWPKNRADGYRWWVSRMRGSLRVADVVRLDHFRGFEACYEIPGNAKNAVGGKWVPGPGHEFFRVMRRELGSAPFIAEDLGFITGAVRDLRDSWGLPGMRVLQMGFDCHPSDKLPDGTNPYLPCHHVPHCVVYPGTHDNNTAVGFYAGLDREKKRIFREYSGSDGRQPHRTLMRLTYGSVARLAVVPVQDVLGLDSRARQNKPGIQRSNIYLWKLVPNQLGSAQAKLVIDLCRIFERLPERDRKGKLLLIETQEERDRQERGAPDRQKRELPIPQRKLKSSQQT